MAREARRGAGRAWPSAVDYLRLLAGIEFIHNFLMERQDAKGPGHPARDDTIGALVAEAAARTASDGP